MRGHGGDAHDGNPPGCDAGARTVWSCMVPPLSAAYIDRTDCGRDGFNSALDVLYLAGQRVLKKPSTSARTAPFANRLRRLLLGADSGKSSSLWST